MKEVLSRSNKNPILKPIEEHNWESKKVYNCGAIYDDGEYHIFYRAVGSGTQYHSSLGHALSKNGEDFRRFENPLLVPESNLEKLGIEDARVTKIDSKYYMTYTGYDGDSARLLIMTSDDLQNWKRHGEAVPTWDLEKAKGFQVQWDEARYTPTALRKWNKSGGIFSEKIDGKYWMLFGDSNMWFAHSDDGINWTPVWEPFITPRKNIFDAAHVEMGPPPIKTNKGWLVLYHGIDEKIVYRIGYLILDSSNPQKILFRSEAPIFQPREPYELSGIVDILPGGLKKLQEMNEKELNDYLRIAEVKGFMPKVTFCCGATLVDNTLRIYYGASDSVIGTATGDIAELLRF